MRGPRSLPVVLALSVAVAVAVALAGLAGAPVGSAAAAECAPTQDPVCEYGANAKEAEPVSSSTSVQPGAIEPLPVNPVIEAEFQAHLAEWEERGKLAVPVRESEVRLVPGLEGGWVGWCMIVRAGAEHSTRCPVAPRPEPVGYESWEAHASATRGVALVGASTEAVAVDDDDTAVATAPVSGISGLSAALVELSAPFPAASHWFDEFEPVFRSIRNSGSRGLSAPEDAYSVTLPASGWQAPQSPPAGVCSLTASHLAGLRPRFGHVVTSLSPTRGIAGGGFASCIDTEYSLARSALDAAVLLDAAQPGTAAPAAPPNAAPVRQHPGLFSAPGWNGQILARRAGDAWLAVEGGASLRQREQVLSHLRASVRG
jgi:hypothetical protein